MEISFVECDVCKEKCGGTKKSRYKLRFDTFEAKDICGLCLAAGITVRLEGNALFFGRLPESSKPRTEVQTDFQRAVIRTKELIGEKSFQIVNDLNGQPAFIVPNGKALINCPAGQIESYYPWGMRFTTDGAFMHSWGDPPFRLE